MMLEASSPNAAAVHVKMSLNSTADETFSIHQFHLRLNGVEEVLQHEPNPISISSNPEPDRRSLQGCISRPPTSARKRFNDQLEPQHQPRLHAKRSGEIRFTSSELMAHQLHQPQLHRSGSCSSQSDNQMRRRRISPSASMTPRQRISPFISGQNSHDSLVLEETSPTTQLQEIRCELDYQGQVLSRVVRDIHTHHENGCSDDNPAIHGLEMVLSEIRGLRDELKEHKSQLDQLRGDVNMLLSNRSLDPDQEQSQGQE